tara:strand:+ start:51997 stop:52131 length:135 start_codon:yes stop_codon:yes gene_type:complete
VQISEKMKSQKIAGGIFGGIAIFGFFASHGKPPNPEGKGGRDII